MTERRSDNASNSLLHYSECLALSENSRENFKTNGLPDFFVDTILSKFPVPETENTFLKNQNARGALKKNFETERCLTSNVQNCTPSVLNPAYYYRPFPSGNYKCAPAESLNYVCRFGNVQKQQVDAGNLKFLHNFDMRQNMLQLQRQMYYSAINNMTAKYSQFSREFSSPVSVHSNFLSNNRSVRHFELQQFSSGESFFGSEQRSGLVGQRHSQAPVTTSLDCNRTHAAASTCSDKTRFILSQLNCLSQRLPLPDLQEGQQENEEKLPPKTHSNSSLNRVGISDSDSIKKPTNLSSVSQRSPETPALREDVAKGDDNHPAWVFCTRYSDRPCAGPRIRRTKKDAEVSKNQSHSKRERTAFSEMQLSKLQVEFETCPYLTEDRRVRLSSELGLSVSQIKVWFQNKRAKVKKASGVQSRLKMGLIASGIYQHGTAISEDKE